MITIIGYLIAIAGLIGLYSNELILGTALFMLGGFLSKGLFFSIHSVGVVLMVVSMAYGYHHEFSSTVIILIVVGFILATFTKKSRRADSKEWGFEIDIGDFFSGSSDGGDDGGD